MKKSDELKQERKLKLDAQKVMIDARAATTEKEFTAEQRTEFEGLNTEIDALEARIATAESDEAAELRIASMSGVLVGGSEAREHEKMKASYSFHKAIRSQMPGETLDGVELEIHQETSKRAKEAGVSITGIAIPMPSKRSEKRADGQTVTQDSGNYGGNLVATDLQSPIEFLRPTPVLETLGARFLTGLQGDLKFPVNDGGIAATWEGEVASVDPTKNAFSSRAMKPNRLAVSALISLQNLMQSSIDLEMFTIDDIRMAIANKIDQAGINGSGASNQPTGILNASGVNTIVGGANGAVPTWANVVDMQSEVFVANANASSMNYLINPATRGKMKKTKHEAGDLGYLMATDNTINGTNVGVSNHVPGDLTKGTAAGIANAGIYGDFSQLLIGQWGFLDLSVDNISRKKDGYIGIDVNTFVDVLVRQPKAFTVVKDWLLA
jgi:HK97 family phage major capsid protein